MIYYPGIHRTNQGDSSYFLYARKSWAYNEKTSYIMNSEIIIPKDIREDYCLEA
ncbi:hypothetical protein D3C72_1787510 [compost metagenome]